MKITYSFSSSIASIIIRYLDLKQSLGRKYIIESRIFQHLDKFLNTTDSDLTAESFAKWCYTQQNNASGVRRNWMRTVHNLCLYRQRTEPLCFIPDPLQFPLLHQPIQPHIFTEDEIIRLFEAIKQLKPGTRSPIRRENFRLALVLLYTTGLRRRELIKLTLGDYNSTERTLLIRESKFHKSRIIPLSQDGYNELEAYLKIRRNRHLPISKESPLLWNKHHKTRIGYYTGAGLWTTFQSLFRIANIHTSNGRYPRLHDFRHAFAVHALLRWYREGENVQAKLPVLSIYMGHVSVVSTQYYLRFIQEVVNSASKRFEKRYSRLVSKSYKRGVR